MLQAVSLQKIATISSTLSLFNKVGIVGFFNLIYECESRLGECCTNYATVFLGVLGFGLGLLIKFSLSY